MRPQPPYLLSLIAAVAVLLLPSDLPAANYGRALVPGETLNSGIDPAADSDDFVFEAGTGWKVSVKVKAAKGTDLAPVVELVAPDGEVTTEGVKAKAAKTSANLKATLAEGGRFAVRVRGASGTGGYALSWTIKQPKVPTAKDVALASNSTTRFPFPARGGTLLSWTLKYKGDGSAQVAKVEDPEGGDAGWDPEDDEWVKRTLTSEAVKDWPLPETAPGGTWNLVVENKLGASTASMTIKMKLPKAVKTTSDLTLAEPVLESISHSISTCGVTVTLSGENLGTSPRGVWFGRKAATSVEVTGGKTLTCKVPGGSGTVDISFEAADGQVAVLEDAFTFKPLPSLTGFDPVVGPGVGRIEMKIFGAGFETEVQGLYEVLVGGVPAFRVDVLSSSVLSCRIPAHVSGPKDVVLRNACGETVVAPGVFTYSNLLTVSVVLPPAVPAFGGVPVTVYGAGFQSTDTVRLDGVVVPTTPVVYSGTVIGHAIAGDDVPPHAPGKVDVKVVAAGGNESVKTAGLAYYAFTDVTASAIPAATATEDWGGVSTAAIDRDGDGTVDYIVISHADALSGTRPGTRILVNDGNGVFSDGTTPRMPTVTPEEGYGAAKTLSARFNLDTDPDLFLVRPGTGTEPRRTSDKKFIDAWAKILVANGAGGFDALPSSGADSKFSVPGQLTYSNCFIYDFDFRGVTAAVGDLDGDLDQDVLLLNDVSIKDFTGVNCNYKWISCAGGYYTACYSFTTVDFGSAVRICTSGSTGSFFDRTEYMLTSAPTPTEDFRGVAAAVGDFNADFLNDFVITHNQAVGTSSATRVFQQKNTGVQVTFQKTSGFVPNPTGGDDWRGDAVALVDLNGDLYRDLVVSLNGPMPNGGPLSTRVLVQNTATAKLEDRTTAVLGGVLPAGDDGRARFILSTDIDRDGDPDLVLATPGDTGAGNGKTRFLLNAGKDEATGLPVLLDARDILPSPDDDAGNAVCILAVDIDGDDDLDLVVTDTHQGNAVKRTRIWRQDR